MPHPIRLPSIRTLLAATLLAPALTTAADHTPDPYDALHDVLMVRQAIDGALNTENETSPTIYSTSAFPFGDATFDRFSTALDTFAALPQSQVESYSEIQRALLQLHLWKVFDTSTHAGNHHARRRTLQPKIAELIRRLALTRDQIQALPDTLAATVKSGGVPRHHSPGAPFGTFLPADLLSGESSWVALGDPRRPIPAHIHTHEASWRSLFLTFMRLPGGRDATLHYLKEINERPGEFPAGTQFALVEQAFLVSDRRELVLSPIVVSVALRAFIDVDRNFRPTRPPTQAVAEFLMQPRQLMAGDARMKALSAKDHRHEVGEGFFPPGQPDPFESGRMPRRTRLNTCMGCHGQKGIDAIQTVINTDYAHFTTGDGPAVVRDATADGKRNDKTWKALLEHWR